MKLWDKGTTVDSFVEQFTVGRDREMDLYLARHDVLGNMAHAQMLASIGLLSTTELAQLMDVLRGILAETEKGTFVISEGVEDVHSQVEAMLTQQLGDTGKKIHTGRSRNDQVLLDIKLFTRDRIQEVVGETEKLFSLLIARSEATKDVVIPGYTHLQVAMPSSFGLWFGAYAECLAEDLHLLLAAYQIANQNPLGSAAGYGSSFPINRSLTTRLLGFDTLSYNVVYAQMGRGRTERAVAFALSSVASTIMRFAMDACLFMNQNFGFIHLPDAFTTGSSIMPHKKNPDVFELLRAKCNKIQALPVVINNISNNLPSGYFRDLQIIKEEYLPAFDELLNCLAMMQAIVPQISIAENILDKDIYEHLFTVEEMNKLVQSGLPLRDAYKKLGEMIKDGSYKTDRQVHHTHEGSIGNLCNTEITDKFRAVKNQFPFEKVTQALAQLVQMK